MKKQTTDNVRRGSAYSSLILILVISAIGYFVYVDTPRGGIEGADLLSPLDAFLGILVYDFLISLLSIIGLVPIAGSIIFFLVANYTLTPWVFGLTGLYSTWLTSTILWVYLGISLFFGLVIAAVVLSSRW